MIVKMDDDINCDDVDHGDDDERHSVMERAFPSLSGAKHLFAMAMPAKRPSKLDVAPCISVRQYDRPDS